MEYYYALRLTPQPNDKLVVDAWRSTIPDFLSIIGSNNYLFGQEFAKNHHFHIVFSHPDEFNTKEGEFIKNFKTTLYELFNVPKNKWGNPTYELEVVRDLEHATSYAVKDGDYHYSPDWETTALEAYDRSYGKKYSLKDSISDLTDKYIRNEINEKSLWVGLGQTRADLGIPLSIRWIDEMLLSIQCKKDPNKLSELWENKIISNS